MNDKQFGQALDRWITREPDYYDGECDNDDHELCEDCGMCPICDKCICEKGGEENGE